MLKVRSSRPYSSLRGVFVRVVDKQTAALSDAEDRRSEAKDLGYAEQDKRQALCLTMSLLMSRFAPQPPLLVRDLHFIFPQSPPTQASHHPTIPPSAHRRNSLVIYEREKAKRDPATDRNAEKQEIQLHVFKAIKCSSIFIWE